MKLVFLCLILGLLGCTYETVYEETMNDRLADKTGWSTTGNLIAGSGDTGISLQANFKATGNYTVQFGITQPILEALSGRVIKALAEITWSVEGNDVRRLVNCVNGMTVSGTGQAVKVRVYDASDANPVEYQVSIQVVKGTRSSVQHPPFLYGDRETLLAGAQTQIPIPQNAGVTSVYVPIGKIGTAGAINNNEIQVIHENLVSVLSQYDPTVFQWVPIAGGATSITIVNNSTADLRITPVWGIDG